MYPVLPSAQSKTTTTTGTRARTPTTGRTQPAETTGRAHLESPTNNKRTSSMIFRIEHLLPHSETTPEQRQGSSSTQSHAQAAARGDYQGAGGAPKRIKLSAARSGVYVAQFTAKDTLSETFSTLSVMSTQTSTTTLSGAGGGAEPTSYCHLSNGVLCMTPAILRKIKLSEDIHSYNALFEIHNGNVRVRVTRDIGPDDELVAWFGEEVTLLMSIPFLTPLNIQGNSRYTCHVCHLTFETPNPLKIHLALACGRHTLDILWIRLHYALKSTTFGQQQLLPPAATLPLPLAPSSAPIAPTRLEAAAHHSPIDRNTMSPFSSSSSSTTSCISPSSSPQPLGPHVAHAQTQPQQHQLLLQEQQSKSPQRLSAFKPISSAPVVVRTHPSLTMPLPPPHLTTVASTSGSTTVFTMHHAMHSHHHPMLGGLPHPSMGLLMPSGGSPSGGGSMPNPLNAAAQIEAIVSNMGASKQGHLCIYCGKVYSRKYGLKIHIRTHTGFKPLKCKFCLRPFGDPSNLNKHVRLHLQAGGSASSSGGPQDGYKCHLCHKTLARRRDLQRHMEARHSQSDDNNAPRK